MTRSELVRETWLLYFNRILRDEGLISEDEYRKMKLLILKKAQAT